MSDLKQQAKIGFAALVAVFGGCALILFVLDRAGLHAPGPRPAEQADAGKKAGDEKANDSAPADAVATAAVEAPAGLDSSASREKSPAMPVKPVSELDDAFGKPEAGSSQTAAAASKAPEQVLVTTTVRTTAYTHTEADHIKYGTKTALGTNLRYTPEYHSVAADWSRFPLGTKFRMKGSDRLFVVDDYGKALVGSSTVDIYFLTKERMNNWGVRWITIDVVEFGSFHESRKILAARANFPHCRAMLASMTSDDWWKSYR